MVGALVGVGATRCVGDGRGDEVAGGAVAVETRAETVYDGLPVLPNRSGPMIKRAPTAPTISMRNANMKTARANVMKSFLS